MNGLTIAVHKHTPTLRNGLINEILCSSHNEETRYRGELQLCLLRKETDEVLFLTIFYVEYHVLEAVRKTRSDGERLFRIAYAHSEKAGWSVARVARVQKENIVRRTYETLLATAECPATSKLARVPRVSWVGSLDIAFAFRICEVKSPNKLGLPI